MLRVLLRLVAQVVVPLAPLVTLQWSLLDRLHLVDPSGNARVPFGFFALTGPKSEVELRLRIWLAAVGIAAVIAYDLVDLYLPRISLRVARRRYLDEQEQKWCENLPDGVRLSILYAHRRWYIGFFRILTWAWCHGFDPPDRNADTGLWLTEWHGLAGAALRAGNVLWLDLRVPGHRPPYLSLGQRLKTKNTKAILCVPLLAAAQRGVTRWRTVGILSVDAVTEPAADYLADQRNALADYFIGEGKILALFR